MKKPFLSNYFPRKAKLKLVVNQEDLRFENGGSDIRQFPFLAVANKKIYLTFSQHLDENIKHPNDGMKVFENFEFNPGYYLANPDFYLTSLITLNDGVLFGMSYITYFLSPDKVTCYYWISEDNGRNWLKKAGQVFFPQIQGSIATPKSNWGGFVFHRTIFQMPDGSLRGTMYGRYVSDQKFRVILVKSTDRGATWTVVTTIAYNPELKSYGLCEPVIARCLDGSLLCVMRAGNDFPLYQCRSHDDGLNWSRPQRLPGVKAADARSVDPDLCLMKNGIMALSFGRPGCKLLFSLDGNGEKWGHLTIVYSAITSGYTGIRETAPDTLLIIGDSGADWQQPREYRIWGKYLTVK